MTKQRKNNGEHRNPSLGTLHNEERSGLSPAAGKAVA